MNNVYIVCPANFQTGGTELCHQFADYLNTRNYNCYLVYTDGQNFIEAEVPKGFRKYNIKTKASIEDSLNNFLILPEASLVLAKKFTKLKLIFWWMSFDNYFNNSSRLDNIKFFIKGLFPLKLFLIRMYIIKSNLTLGFKSIKKIEINRIIHVYQSKYASLELHKQDINNQLPLSDYINLEFVEYYKENINKENKKNDIVLYNPVKGINITNKLIKALPTIQFIPLQGLSRDELNSLFRTSKVYIDFGNHPGKDRLPREACINGCSIIVGRNGSAKYFEDVPILEKYKFYNDQINEIKECILSIFDNFEESSNDFKFFRNNILKEKELFYKEIDHLIDYMNLKNLK
jgi:hypothetical protein